MQGTWVRSLVQEDLSRRATAVLQLLKPSSLEPVLCNRISHQDEKTKHSDEE